MANFTNDDGYIAPSNFNQGNNRVSRVIQYLPVDPYLTYVRILS